jgi:hypothetical protein
MAGRKGTRSIVGAGPVRTATRRNPHLIGCPQTVPKLWCKCAQLGVTAYKLTC